MMKSTLLVIKLVVLLCFFGCKKSTNSEENESQDPQYDVFIAGTETNGSNTFVQLWKNGQYTNLTDGKSVATVSDMYVSGKDVYLVGYIWRNNKNLVAALWKNNELIELTDGKYSSRANSVWIDGNDVYIVGYEGSPNGDIAKLWKNGIASNLLDKSKEGQANSIFIKQKDIYVGGTYYDIGDRGGFIWKNGVVTDLGKENIYESNSIKKIFVTDGAVYAVGWRAFGQVTNATVWKDGVVTLFDKDIESSFASSIYVKGDDVYVVGQSSASDNSKAVLWKNGVKTILSQDDMQASAIDIKIINNDVFITGFEMPKKGTISVMLWKNNTPFKISNSNKYAVGNSIFVSKR
ncbi:MULTISPECIES: hypothetical protein [unclassified Sphingobacterium]|uniref:hypothetical protein n=1 Tax=unclassified Sphingobacterium TaxID=2609468 RepID=UPI0010484319|nr:MULTISPECIES: hypothetical protein [unclassified Sphingobacterium]MCS3557378.1 hypothetical protein [Sphingobacterium sp. JUb21]TCQ96675.1 hypothetical protein EDF66_12117 [Sphingobacterium sp. JUb20]